jgi:hypothetical protein
MAKWLIVPGYRMPYRLLNLAILADLIIPICPVFSYEAPEGSRPAFATRDVVDGANATGIRSITERPSLPPSSRVRTAVGPSCDVLSLCGERYGFILFRWNDAMGLGLLFTPAV